MPLLYIYPNSGQPVLYPSGTPIIMNFPPDRSGKEVIPVNFQTPADIKAIESNGTWKEISRAEAEVLIPPIVEVVRKWEDVKSKRVIGVTYTNTNETDLVVIVNLCNRNSGNSTWTFFIDGAIAGQHSTGVLWSEGSSYIIPPGSTYYAKGAGFSIEVWKEYIYIDAEG